MRSPIPELVPVMSTARTPPASWAAAVGAAVGERQGMVTHQALTLSGLTQREAPPGPGAGPAHLAPPYGFLAVPRDKGSGPCVPVLLPNEVGLHLVEGMHGQDVEVGPGAVRMEILDVGEVRAGDAAVEDAGGGRMIVSGTNFAFDNWGVGGFYKSDNNALLALQMTYWLIGII